MKRPARQPTQKFGKTGRKPNADPFRLREVIPQLVNSDPTLQKALAARKPEDAPARRVVLTK